MRIKFVAAILALAFLTSLSQIAIAAAPIPVRVVVITTFEIGDDTGDMPGEFQAWVERLPLSKKLPFPQGYQALRYDPAKQILGIVTGEGPTHSAASIMGLGMDPRFDLSKAYWIVAGIGGVNPHYASGGSAAWAEWVVDFDLKSQIAGSDIPAGWGTGMIPIMTAKPFPEPHPEIAGRSGTVAYHLNPALVDWAYKLTADTKLDDTPDLKAIRAGYADTPNGAKPPFVLKGDEISSATWWVGDQLNEFMERWMRYWSDGKGTSVTSAMEDMGILQSLTFLSAAKRADINRVLVLRTASDYGTPPKGQTAAELLAESASTDTASKLSAFHPALEAAYRVGSPVVLEIADHWDRYAAHPPGGLP